MCPTLGVVIGLSPVKDNRAKTWKWFDGEITNEESVVHFVAFDPKLWHAMEKSKGVLLAYRNQGVHYHC